MQKYIFLLLFAAVLWLIVGLFPAFGSSYAYTNLIVVCPQSQASAVVSVADENPYVIEQSADNAVLSFSYSPEAYIRLKKIPQISVILEADGYSPLCFSAKDCGELTSLRTSLMQIMQKCDTVKIGFPYIISGY